ncbi:MAG: sigma 54-interacting transcriptional regulator [Bryobacteraceae bacterium]|nr:sigma 54-interacting transcriptional regulator [Bryobacteraceae bacterium]MDW8380415.1 sigma 54-interacting transcriptional regulator [Bryobacterales bacterium]
MSKLLDRWHQTKVLEAVFDHLSDALILYDADMRITGVNRAAELMFGLGADQMVGMKCAEVFRCAGCEHDCGILLGVNQPQVANGTIRLRTATNMERMAVIRTTRLYSDDGRLEGAIATVKDITEEFLPQRRDLVAESKQMREIEAFIRRVAASEASTILIEGENGTGKDLIAKTIHYSSMRQAEPFIAINCAAIPETLLESELFGYEKGAFTDAKTQKRGLFELADKGTLFLDEVGEIPLMLQAKLLRVLEEQTFRRLGGLKDIHLDVRVIAATNRNLREAVKEGAFRQDLYFRLNVIHIQIPPLRERREDILPLARYFVEHYNQKFKRQILGFTPEAEALLRQHDWPGNVREVRNAVERAMILEDSSYITPASLPLSLAERAPQPALAPSEPFPEGGVSLQETEKQLLIRALEKTNGNQTQAARLLRITRDTLRYKMKKFNLR